MLVSEISPAPAARHARAPRDRVEARVGVRPPCVNTSQRGLGRRRRIAARVDGDDDGLAAERVRGAAHELGIGDRGRVDADLVGAREQQLAHVVDRAHAAAHGERQEHPLGRARARRRAIVAAPSGDAEMSRKQISSAPCAS